MTKVYMVEVGVELENTDSEFSSYSILVVDENSQKGYQSLYDENIIAFLNKQEAIDCIDEYVKKGIKNTYGFMWLVEREICEDELEELECMNYLEGTYDRETVLYF